MKRIVYAALTPVFFAIFIWLIVGFVRWDFDLSGMESVDRELMIVWWLILSAFAECFVLFALTIDSEDEDDCDE